MTSISRISYFSKSLIASSGISSPSATIGIAGGQGEGLLFKKGEQIRKIKEENLVDELIRELKIMKDVIKQ